MKICCPVVLLLLVVLCNWIGAARAAGSENLIESVDFSRAELSGVKTAWEKKDVAAARRAFAEHLRTRTNVRWHPNAASQSEAVTSGEQRTADDAVDHAFTVSNIRYQFPKGSEVDWKFNPTAQADS